MFPNPNKSIHDLIISFIVVTLAYLILAYFGIYLTISKDYLSLFITIFIGIVGVLITILTILFAFENVFSKNKAIKILKERDEYKQIYKRFIDSTFGLFYSIIIFSVLYVLYGTIFIIENIFYVSTLSFILVTFCFIKIYRAFYLFKIYYEVISDFEKGKK